MIHKSYFENQNLSLMYWLCEVLRSLVLSVVNREDFYRYVLRDLEQEVC